MAWRRGDGTHQFRKQASSALRSGEKRDAIADAQDAPLAGRKKSRAKKFGLELFYKSLFKQGRVVSFTQWYEKERDREQALRVESGKMLLGRPRWCKIERVSR